MRRTRPICFTECDASGPSLPDAEAEESRSRMSSTSTRPVISPERPGCQPNILGRELPVRRGWRAVPARRKRRRRRDPAPPVPLAGQHRVARPGLRRGSARRRRPSRPAALLRSGGDREVDGRRNGAAEIGLGARPREPGRSLRRRHWLARRNEPEHEVRRLGPRPARARRPPARPVLAVAQARRIDERDRQAAEIAADLDRVPRRAGDRGDDGDIAARERVEQRRLAGIRRAGENDRQALPQALAARLGEHGCDRGRKDREAARGPVLERLGNVALVGEIQGGFEQREELRCLSRQRSTWRPSCPSSCAGPDGAAPPSRHRSGRQGPRPG